MTTDDELRELIAKGEKATARPWVECACGSCGQIMSKPVDCEVADLRLHIQSCEEEGFPYSTKYLADATYITAAANLAPDIARELIAARALVEQLRKAIESVRDVGWYSPVTPEYKAAWKKVDAILKGGDL